jgi:50S ribosomal subunit-associated GTPase HflX
MKTAQDRLYYECHLTIAPVFNERLMELERLAGACGFKVAKLLMEKGRSTKDSFCTAHGKDFEELRSRMYQLSDDLNAAGFQLWRRKIEAVVLDERFPRDPGV